MNPASMVAVPAGREPQVHEQRGAAVPVGRRARRTSSRSRRTASSRSTAAFAPSRSSTSSIAGISTVAAASRPRRRRATRITRAVARSISRTTRRSIGPMADQDWSHSVPGDPVHFDHLGSPDIRGRDVLAFQRLWNRNNPNDQIAEDGDYGPATESRLGKRRRPASRRARAPIRARRRGRVGRRSRQGPARHARRVHDHARRTTAPSSWPANTQHHDRRRRGQRDVRSGHVGLAERGRHARHRDRGRREGHDRSARASPRWSPREPPVSTRARTRERRHEVRLDPVVFTVTDEWRRRHQRRRRRRQRRSAVAATRWRRCELGNARCYRSRSCCAAVRRLQRSVRAR